MQCNSTVHRQSSYFRSCEEVEKVRVSIFLRCGVKSPLFSGCKEDKEFVCRESTYACILGIAARQREVLEGEEEKRDCKKSDKLAHFRKKILLG